VTIKHIYLKNVIYLNGVEINSERFDKQSLSFFFFPAQKQTTKMVYQHVIWQYTTESAKNMETQD
jgi:sRNA-binding regulator protein Hfq